MCAYFTKKEIRQIRFSSLQVSFPRKIIYSRFFYSSPSIPPKAIKSNSESAAENQFLIKKKKKKTICGKQGLSAQAQRDLTRGTPRCPSAGPASARLAGTLGVQGACGAASAHPRRALRLTSGGTVCLEAAAARGVLQPRSLDAVTPALCLCLWGIRRPGLLGPPGPSAAASRSPSRELRSRSRQRLRPHRASMAEASRLLHPRAGRRAACPLVRSLRSL